MPDMFSLIIVFTEKQLNHDSMHFVQFCLCLYTFHLYLYTHICIPSA